MEDDIFTCPATRGFQALINKNNRIVVMQDDMLDGRQETILLSIEEAEYLAECLKKLAKDLREEK